MKFWIFKLLYKFAPKKKKRSVQNIQMGGLLLQPEDPRDYPMPGSMIAETVTYPAKFSLRDSGNLTQVENQGEYNSCVAHAVTTAVETYAKVKGWPNSFELSRMHVWNEGRKLSNTYPENQGMFIRDGWKTIQNNGATIEELFPYNYNSYNKDIGMAAQIFSRWYPPFKYYWITGNTTTDKMLGVKAALAKGVPVAFGVGLPASFFTAKSTDVYKPADGERIQFYHAMLVTGYDADRGTIEVMNSWGPVWGEVGFVHVDSEWLLSHAFEISFPWE